MTAVITKVSDLFNYNTRNKYGELAIDFELAIKTAYPDIEIVTRTPGARGLNPDCWVSESDEGKWRLSVPDGKYVSSSRTNTAGHAIVFIESSRKKLNLAGCPLFLISGRQYLSKWSSLTKTYFLFGKNEDGSYFCHKIRPKFAQQTIDANSLDPVRNWLWDVKKNESIAARQGDLAFITKKRQAGKKEDGTEVHIGNHHVIGAEVYRTEQRIYVLNPVANHHEHDAVNLTGWHELRLAKVWQGSTAD